MLSASASRHPHALTSASLIQTLSSLLLRSGDGSVALLRPITNDFNPDRDDVDLLLTDQQRAALLQVALEESAAGRIHLTVRQKCSEKVQLTLWNLAATQRLTVDLWSVFSQLPNHPRMLIRAEDLLRFTGHASDSDAQGWGSIRLSADVDFCLLVLHWAVKKKLLNSASVRERIRLASDRLVISIPELFAANRPADELASLIEVSKDLRTVARTIPNRSVRIAENFLLARLIGVTLQPRTNRNLFTGIRSWLMKRVRCVAVVGSDGAGKSSLCEAIGRRTSGNSPIVAKKLYRCSWLYRVVSSVTKKLTGFDRGRFDDSVAQLITLRAAGSLWLCLAIRILASLCGTLSRPIRETWSWFALRVASFPATGFTPVVQRLPALLRLCERQSLRLAHKPLNHRGKPGGDEIQALLRASRATTFLLDRSLSSFLITNRKSERPRLSRFATWLEQILPPVTTVLLVVPFPSLVRRKAEFTSAAGHARYQQLLFEQALRQRPCDLIVLANTGSAEDAACAFDSIRSRSLGTLGPGHQASLNPLTCRNQRSVREETVT